ncbi:HCLS1-associated protein X-1 isoform X2 [Varanus komodoensis]|uniref:HCLS1 associated protein X-1 n=1 Tax=Varanus komodoensis TaxID=61221 RepID=A0A8D2Q2G8_VARKO|nr:HCLS1-associated protein X-1 isoform X2 [Varanus komodoensis]
MSLYDLFRGFFGFRGERRPRDPFFGGITRDDEDEDDEDEDESPFFGARRSDDFAFGFTFGPGGMRFHDSFGFDELFQDFNDLFSEMGARSLPLHPFEFPGVEAPPPADRPLEKRQTLRDSMLKYPDSQRFSRRTLEDGFNPATPERRPLHPFQGRAAEDVTDTSKEDRDLDSHVTSEGLETVLPPAQPRSYFKSVSVTKVIAPDGTIEERRTVRDSQGREETVVTRRGGGEPSSGQQGSPADVLPFDSRHREDMSDSWSILDTFFRRWFSSR